MNDLIVKIEQWANDRNLIDGSDTLSQLMKLFSEFGELSDSVGKNYLEGIKDGIGDVFVVLTILCRQSGYSLPIEDGISSVPQYRNIKEKVKMCLVDIVDWAYMDNCENSRDLQRTIQFLAEIANYYNLTLQECVEHSYNEIKDRKGIVHNGVFVKESDPQYEAILEKLKV